MVVGSKRLARILVEALSGQISATLVVGGTSKIRRREKIEDFRNGVQQIIVLSTFNAMSSAGVIPATLKITHIFNYTLPRRLSQYLDNLDLLQSKGLMTTYVTAEDMKKRRLITGLKQHLRDVKQLPEKLRE